MRARTSWLPLLIALLSTLAVDQGIARAQPQDRERAARDYAEQKQVFRSNRDRGRQLLKTYLRKAKEKKYDECRYEDLCEARRSLAAAGRARAAMREARARGLEAKAIAKPERAPDLRKRAATLRAAAQRTRNNVASFLVRHQLGGESQVIAPEAGRYYPVSFLQKNVSLGCFVRFDDEMVRALGSTKVDLVSGDLVFADGDRDPITREYKGNWLMRVSGKPGPLTWRGPLTVSYDEKENLRVFSSDALVKNEVYYQYEPSRRNIGEGGTALRKDDFLLQKLDQTASILRRAGIDTMVQVQPGVWQTERLPSLSAVKSMARLTRSTYSPKGKATQDKFYAINETLERARELGLGGQATVFLYGKVLPGSGRGRYDQLKPEEYERWYVSATLVVAQNKRTKEKVLQVVDPILGRRPMSLDAWVRKFADKSSGPLVLEVADQHQLLPIVTIGRRRPGD